MTARELVANEANFPPGPGFEYVFVNDGSGGDALGALRQAQQRHLGRIRIVGLAGNVGSCNAIVAGIAHATGDCLAVITANRQDPPELMMQMYAYWQQGFRLVIGNRKDREEKAFSQWLTKQFHWLMKNQALRNIPDGGFDFAFFDRQAADEVLKLHARSSNVFYLMGWLGFSYVNIPYVRQKREMRKLRRALSKKIKLLVGSLLSFSFSPVRFISPTGISLSLVAVLYGVCLIVLRLSGSSEPVVLFVSALHMLALGIISEYVWCMWRSPNAARSHLLCVVRDVYEARAGSQN